MVPLALDGQSAHFLGRHEVCDYQDIITMPGQAQTVVQALLDHLVTQGVKQLDLRTLRPDAVVIKAMKQLASQQPLEMTLEADDVTFETALPTSWEGYLQHLNGKQRHEVRRKVRRLEAHGPIVYRPVRGDNEHLDRAADTFIQLFRRNRQDKAAFMTHAMEGYFRDLIKALAKHGMLQLFFLEVDGQVTATVLCFDYDHVRYLYNSGYDERYHPLSVGILSKVFSIQKGIENGCRRYDFLKGDEVYKKRIGGQEVPLYRCRLHL